MLMHSGVGYSVATLATLLAALTWTRPASAQPDPFEDYERWKSGETETSEPATPVKGPVAAEGPWAGFNKGTWTVGGRLQLAYVGTTNEVTPDIDESHNTFFLRLAPTVGYTIIDRIQAAVSLGILSKNVSSARGQGSNETNFFFEASGYYLLPMGDHFALVPGVGLGFYLGSGSRNLTVNNTVTEESTSTSGFAAALYLGLGYSLSENWQIRSGLALNALLGSESIPSSDHYLSSSMVHIGLPLELYYTF